MANEYETLEDIVRTQYVNVVWTHKIQEKQAEIYERCYRILSIINIVGASLTSVGVFSVIFNDELCLKIFSTVVAFITTTISAILASFNYNDMAKANKATATKLVRLRNNYQVLLTKMKYPEPNLQDLTNEYEDLLEQTHDVYSNAPNTTSRAVKKASVALKVKNDGVYSNEEIDAFLPESLRRNQNE